MFSVSSPSHKERSLSKALLKRAILLALLIHLFGMVAVPDYAVEAIKKKSTDVIRDVDVVVIDRHLEPPPYPPRIPEPYEVEEKDIKEDGTLIPTKLGGTKPIPDPGKYIPRDTDPEIIRIQNPSYPSVARAAGIEAEVWLYMFVDVDGRVKDVRIISGPELFHESVREAAYRLIFDPATYNNRKVAVWVAMKFDFVLED